MKKFLIVVLLILFIFLSYHVLEYFYKFNENRSIPIFTEYEDKCPIDFSIYNNDVKGYIQIEPLGISYPVMQSIDNKYYLTHNKDKEYSKHGSIFFDYQADIENINNLQNIFIYGHHMKDKTMFGRLSEYMNKKGWNSNQKIYLYLKNINAKIELEVFSAYSTQQNYMYEKFFADKQSLNKYITEARKISKYSTNLKEYGNTIFTLYTCSYEKQDARYFVHAGIKEIHYYGKQ